ncbi:MAG: hypothetical protein AABX39_01790 [Nanoarchaeota archaeon]
MKYLITEMTPLEYRCFGGLGCPAAFEDSEKEEYLIIGTEVDPKNFDLDKRVGKGEVLIKIPKKILEDILKK